MSFTNTKHFFLQYDKSHLFRAFQKSHYKNTKKKRKPVGPELLVKSLLLLKCKRQQRGERRRREAEGGRVTRGNLARGMTSQQCSWKA